MTSHFMNQPFLVYDGVLGRKYKQGVQQEFSSKQLAAAKPLGHSSKKTSQSK